MVSDDEQPLLDRAVAQDPDAWEQIYRRAYPRLIAYACRRLATRDQADDAVAEAMVRAIHSIDRYVPGRCGLDGWMFGILRFVVLEQYRAQPSPRAEIGEGPSDEIGPLDHVVRDEEHVLIRNAFDKLDDDDRELLSLRVVAGLGADDVGELLGKRPGAVRTAESRALGRLRSKLQEVGG